MSYPEFFVFTDSPDATIAPADLTLFDHQPQYPEVQHGIIDQFSQSVIDPGVGFGGMTSVDYTAWSWPDSLDLTQPQASLQHDHSQPQTEPNAFTGARSTTWLDPLTQAFEHNNTVYQPAAEDGWTASEPQARPNDYGTMDKVGELMAMILDLRTKTDQRMTSIEEEIKAVRSR